MKYLHKFTSEAAFDAAYTGFDYIEPWVSCIQYPIKLSATTEHEDIITIEYQGPVTLADETEGYLWYNTNRVTDNVGYFTYTRAPENYLNNIYLVDGNTWDWNDGGIAISNITVLESDTNYQVNYNKELVDWDFELVYHNIDECNTQLLRNFSSRLGVTGIDPENDHIYIITGTAFTTNPISSFKVKISNHDTLSGVYTVNSDENYNDENHWFCTVIDENNSEIYLVVDAYNSDDTWTLSADFTGGC